MKRGCSRIFGDISDGSPSSSSPCLRDPRLRRLPSHAQSVAQSELGLRPGLFEASQNVDKIHGNGAASDTRVWWWVVTCPRKLPWDRLLCSRAPAATHKTSTIVSHSTSSPTSLMPTLIKGIISHVTDPLLTLTANAGANDQGNLLSCNFLFCSRLVFTVVASQSFPADVPASDLDQFQSMPINSPSSCFHTSLLLLRHMFSPIRHNRVPQCWRQRKRDSTDWCAGSRHRHRPATAGRAAGGGLCLLSPLLFCSTLLTFRSTIWPARRIVGVRHTGAITAPTHPALPCCGIQS